MSWFILFYVIRVTLLPPQTHNIYGLLCEAYMYEMHVLTTLYYACTYMFHV